MFNLKKRHLALLITLISFPCFSTNPECTRVKEFEKKCEKVMKADHECEVAAKAEIKKLAKSQLDSGNTSEGQYNALFLQPGANWRMWSGIQRVAKCRSIMNQAEDLNPCLMSQDTVEQIKAINLCD